ncbi:unannotated protein [freshwater metagenome]|uniref:Unannotated protein n=1 Tax=freshwater metagenome TaxID=449393 RepID=A0A6J7B0F2_9ZZZZ
MAWVAPTVSASANFSSVTSIAIIVVAPAKRAPCTIFKPTPPQPKTATREPALTAAVFMTAP